MLMETFTQESGD